MIQKIKIKKIVILLCILYTITLPIVAAQAGDLDSAFGVNGIVKSVLVPASGYSVTGLIVRGSSYDDIVTSCIKIVNNQPDNQSLLASYKNTNGDLNRDVFGNPTNLRGFILSTIGIQYKTITSFIENGVNRLAVAGKITLGNLGYMAKTTATGEHLDFDTVEPACEYNSIIADQTNQYLFAAGNTIATQPAKSYKLTRVNSLSDIKNNTSITQSFVLPAQINSITLQSNGDLVFAGQSTPASADLQFTVGRYFNDLTLDSSFSLPRPFPEESEAKAITMQIVDGSEKIVAAGWVKINNKKKLALVRYNLDGTLDTTFGTGGKVTANFGGDSAAAHAVAIDKNNKIIVVGEFFATAALQPIFIVACYNKNGYLDTSFGTNGWVTTSPTEYGASLNAVAIDEKNRIVCGGYSINETGRYDITLARYIGSIITPQPGDLDSAFGVNGIVKSVLVASEGYSVTSLILRKSPFNDIVVSCINIVNNEPYPTSILASYKANGSLNVGAFGAGNPARGYVKTLGPTYDTIAAFTENGADRLVAAGKLTALGSVGYINKTTATGINLNSAQKGAGTVYHSVVVDQANQYIFAGGDFTTALQPKKSFKFSRFNSFSDLNDSTDIVTDFPGTSASHINSIALQLDGHLVAVGQVKVNTNPVPQFTLARYSQEAALDNFFGRIEPFSEESEAKAVVMQLVSGHEKIVAAGWVKRNNKKNLALVRYNLDGSPDNTFGSQGRITTDFGGDSAAAAHAVAIDKNNKIIVVGEFLATTESQPVFIVACYNKNGSLDTSFGPNSKGWVITSPTLYGSTINAVAIDENNTIVCGGYSINQSGLYEITLARYLGSRITPKPGDLDTVFGDNGIVKSEPIADIGFSTTGLILRESPYNDIIITAVPVANQQHQKQEKSQSQQFPNQQLLDQQQLQESAFQQQQSIVASYKKIDGSLNIGKFGTGNQGFTVAPFSLHNALTSFISNGTMQLMIGQKATFLSDIPRVKKTSATGIDIGNSSFSLPEGAFNAVTVDQANQAIFAAGNTLPSQSSRFTRFNLSDFGNIIDTITTFAGPSYIHGIAIQSNSRIVAAGQATQNTIPLFFITRYLQDATLDPSFPTLYPFPQEGSANAITMQTVSTGEKIVAAGWIKENNKKKLALVRYNINGTLDTNFGAQQTGKITTDFGGNSAEAHAVAIDQNNKIVVVGKFVAQETPQPFFIVARYHSNGLLDEDFGQDELGWVVTMPSRHGSAINSVSIDGDNSIVCGGFSINDSGIYEITLARYIGSLNLRNS